MNGISDEVKKLVLKANGVINLVPMRPGGSDKL